MAVIALFDPLRRRTALDDLARHGCVVAVEDFGLAALQAGEETGTLVARAAWAAKNASVRSLSVARASTGPVPRLSQPLDVVEDLGATLGGTYRLLHEISRGGMGVVYRAEDLALERPVAIKMLRPDLAEDRAFVDGLRVPAGEVEAEAERLGSE